MLFSRCCLPNPDKCKKGDDSSLPGRILSYSLKVTNRSRTMYFFRDILGMKILRHNEYSEDGDSTEGEQGEALWSKTMVGYGPEDKYFALELIYNYPIRHYDKGNGLICITIKSSNCLKRAKKNGWPIFETNRLETPDGFSFQILDEPEPSKSDPIVSVVLAVSKLKRSLKYWHDMLGMDIITSNIVRYKSSETVIELRQVKHPIQHGDCGGRLSLSLPHKDQEFLEYKLEKYGYKIIVPVVSIDREFLLLLIQDPDGHELCYYDEKGYSNVAVYSPTDEAILDKMLAIEEAIDVKDEPAKRLELRKMLESMRRKQLSNRRWKRCEKDLLGRYYNKFINLNPKKKCSVKRLCRDISKKIEKTESSEISGGSDFEEINSKENIKKIEKGRFNKINDNKPALKAEDEIDTENEKELNNNINFNQNNNEIEKNNHKIEKNNNEIEKNNEQQEKITSDKRQKPQQGNDLQRTNSSLHPDLSHSQNLISRSSVTFKKDVVVFSDNNEIFQNPSKKSIDNKNEDKSVLVMLTSATVIYKTSLKDESMTNTDSKDNLIVHQDKFTETKNEKFFENLKEDKSTLSKMNLKESITKFQNFSKPKMEKPNISPVHKSKSRDYAGRWFAKETFQYLRPVDKSNDIKPSKDKIKPPLKSYGKRTSSQGKNNVYERPKTAPTERKRSENLEMNKVTFKNVKPKNIIETKKINVKEKLDRRQSGTYCKKKPNQTLNKVETKKEKHPFESTKISPLNEQHRNTKVQNKIKIKPSIDNLNYQPQKKSSRFSTNSSEEFICLTEMNDDVEKDKMIKFDQTLKWPENKDSFDFFPQKESARISDFKVNDLSFSDEIYSPEKYKSSKTFLNPFQINTDKIEKDYDEKDQNEEDQDEEDQDEKNQNERNLNEKNLNEKNLNEINQNETNQNEKNHDKKNQDERNQNEKNQDEKLENNDLISNQTNPFKMNIEEKRKETFKSRSTNIDSLKNQVEKGRISSLFKAWLAQGQNRDFPLESRSKIEKHKKEGEEKEGNEVSNMEEFLQGHF